MVRLAESPREKSNKVHIVESMMKSLLSFFAESDDRSLEDAAQVLAWARDTEILDWVELAEHAAREFGVTESAVDAAVRAAGTAAG